ncbi:MAG: hypothetical protein WAO76_15895 [Georgfuchsia sp.]
MPRDAQRIGPIPVALAFDGPQIRRLPDKRGAFDQRWKPDVLVADKVFLDRFVVAVSQTGAHQLQRQYFLIAQGQRKFPSPQPRLHNLFVCRAYLAIHTDDKVLDGHGRLPRSVGHRQTHNTADLARLLLNTAPFTLEKSHIT